MYVPLPAISCRPDVHPRVSPGFPGEAGTTHSRVGVRYSWVPPPCAGILLAIQLLMCARVVACLRTGKGPLAQLVRAQS